MKKGAKLILLIICLVLLLGGGFYCINFGTVRKADDNEDFYSNANNLVNKTESAISNKIYKSLVLSNNNSTVINNSGIYVLSGTYEETNITIDSEDEVVLILNNVNLSNSYGAVINVENAKEVLIYLTADSNNTIVSGTEIEISSSQDDQSGAAIYSKDNLYLAGNGTLVVNGYINNAIVSNDTLLLLSGIYNIEAINNGLKVHDYLQIYGGTYNITSGNDGIKAENDEDASLGNISIYGGDININAYGDGISALSDLIIEDAYITISSPNYSDDNSSVSSDITKIVDDEMVMNSPSNNIDNKNNSSNAKTFDDNLNKQAGEMPDDVSMNNERVAKNNNQSNNKDKNVDNNEISIKDNDNGTSSNDSNKGLKASNLIKINGGTINIATSDDCIHSNNNIIINGGNYNLSSDDDGIHADNILTINDGEIVVENSYEGIEGHQIYVNNGTINLYSSDDGFNASGNNDCILEFNGGTIYVNANGDGLDSNGDLIINAGYIIVDGPTNSSNGPLDSGSENGGSLIVNGGELLAIGAKGMDESFDSASSQCTIHLQTSSNYISGTNISILNEDNEELFTYTSKKSFSSIVYTSSLLQEGITYYVLVDDDSYTVSTNNDSTNFNNNVFSSTNRRGNSFENNKH